MVLTCNQRSKKGPISHFRIQNFSSKGKNVGCKPQTMVIVAMGISVLFLLSLEPIIVYPESGYDTAVPSPQSPSIQHMDKQKIYDHENGNGNKGLFSFSRPGSSLSHRYGMLDRQALRTDFLHPIDPSFRSTNSNIDKKTKESPISSISYPRVVVLGELKWERTPNVENHVHFEIFEGEQIQSSQLVVEKPQNGIKSSRNGENETIQLLPSSDQQSKEYEDEQPLPFERPFFEDCKSIVEPKVHPTCNYLHELTLQDESIEILSLKGSWRTAWKVQNDTAVLKILQWKREFNRQAYDQHALDVIVSDRLTASPYVINAYGFCGQSILQEWAPSSARDFVKSYDIRNRQRLKIARDLARGLADVQALQKINHERLLKKSPHPYWIGGMKYQEDSLAPVPPPLVFSHNDINIANTIQVNGRVKWNDFNIGLLLRNTIESNLTEECGAPVQYRADLWRSPEEVKNTSYVQPQFTDMYGFGNILYQVMTRHQPWTHKEPEGKLSTEQVAQRKQEGRLPTIPEKYKNTTNRDLLTMMMATMSCYHPIPEKRLTAYELSHALGIVYERLQQKKKVTFDLLRALFFSK